MKENALCWSLKTFIFGTVGHLARVIIWKYKMALSSDGISGRRRCRYYKDRGIVYHSVKDVLRLTFVSDSGTDRYYRGFKAAYIKVKYIATTTGKLFRNRL